MPVNGSRNNRISMTTAQPVNGPAAFDTSFLFEADEDSHSSVKSPVAQAYAQLGGDDTFPTLTKDGLRVSVLSN